MLWHLSKVQIMAGKPSWPELGNPSRAGVASLSNKPFQSFSWALGSARGREKPMFSASLDLLSLSGLHQNDSFRK